MFKLDRKSLVSLSLVAAATMFSACQGDAAPEADAKASTANTFMGKATIDGSKVYPIANGKTSVYYVNEKAHTTHFNYGRTPTKDELHAWNTDVTPSKLPPVGEGSVEDGEEIYEAKCVMCHGDFGAGGGGYPALSKGNAYDLQKTLTNNRWKDPEADGPVRVFGSYWPEASTLWWYIHDGMPHPKSKTLTVDETYALTAYILNINEFEIDGEEVDDEYVLDQEKFSKIKMPNRDGFEPNIRGANALDDVRAYYAKAANFGGLNLNQGAKRCMSECQKPTAKVVRIAEGGGIRDFKPPMATARDLPVEKSAIDPAQVYKNTCAMCHSSYLPAGSPDWAAITAEGMDTVYANAIAGTEGGMPAKGGTTLSDAEFKTVVDYIIKGK